MTPEGMGDHPDLRGRAVCFRDFVGRRRFLYDDSGHGTHVCGILCGSGRLSGGRLRGMAPGVRLVLGKVLDRNGDGSTEAMLEGLDWVLELREEYGIRIVNISVGIGSLRERRKEDLLQERIERLWRKGILVVCAAGNKGPREGSISAVGGKCVVTVGCYDGSFAVGNPRSCELYSGRGFAGSPVRKPDLVAPGTDILSCGLMSQGGQDRGTGPYVAKSGTSMATPIVAGSCALLMEWGIVRGNDVFLYGEKVKAYLRAGARALRGETAYPNSRVGWGGLCVSSSLPT